MRIRFLAIFLCLAAGTLMAQQTPGPGSRGPRMGPGMAGPGAAGPGGGQQLDALKDVLGLTDEQVTKLRDLQRERMENGRSLRQEIGQQQRALQEALRGGSTDAAALGNMLLGIERARKQLQDTDARYHELALAVLDATQRSRLAGLEEALKLQPAIRQAMALNLLKPDRPEGQQGPRMRGR